MNYDILKEHKFVPVVVFNSLDEVEPKLTAMSKGGILVAEITFRTACASDAIKLATKLFPNMLIGAGTILCEKMCKEAIQSGAKFIVSPGISNEVAEISKQNKVPYIPGVATPSEIMQALNLGLSYLKFFPCDIFGGIKTLKAYSSVFPSVKFMATTLRESLSANDNNWSAMLFDGKKAYFSNTYQLHIVDRVGGGDSFSAGLIYALRDNMNCEQAIEFAVCASCLKHTIEGDFNLVTVSEVFDLINNGGNGRVQR